MGAEPVRKKAPERRYERYCKKCGIAYMALHKTGLFCCKRHCNAYNERRRKLEKALKGKVQR